MTPADVLFIIGPFVVLAWASLGRGAVGRGRTQVMLLCAFAVVWHWAGVFGLASLTCILGTFMYRAVRRHRLPELPSFQPGPVEMRDFRGTMNVHVMTDGTSFSHFLDYRQDIGTALLEYKVYTDGAGTYLSFGRTTLKRNHADGLWMHSYFQDGGTIGSSDELRAIDFPTSFQLIRMKVLNSLSDLYDFHKAGLAQHPAQPLTFTPDAYLERLKFNAVRRYQDGCSHGYLEPDGTAYRYTVRLTLRSMLQSMDPLRAIKSEAEVGSYYPRLPNAAG